MSRLSTRMTDRTVTLAVPEELYRELEAQAQVGAVSIDEVVLGALRRHLPPVEADLPPEIQAELRAMDYLADDALWQIASASMNADKVALWDVLLDRKQAGELTPEGQDLLSRLRDEGELLTLRKAHAYMLLKARGHAIPTLDDLHPEDA